MQNQDAKRLHNLVVRLGDQGKSLYKRDLQKFVELATATATAEESSTQLFGHLRDAIRLIPGKAFVYAVVASLLQSAFGDGVERLIDQLFEDFKTAVGRADEVSSINLIQFFSELALLGLLNAFTFISILMDLISTAEVRRERSGLLIRALLEAIAAVRGQFADKYGLEFKNLIDDLNRLFAEARTAGGLDLAHEEAFYAAIIGFSADVGEQFGFGVAEVTEMVRQIRPIRKNFKFSLEGQPGLGTVQEATWVQPFAILGLKVETFAPSNRRLNLFLIGSLLSRLVTAFRRNAQLMLEKVFSIDYMGYAEAKNYLMIEQAFWLMLGKGQSGGDEALAVKLLSELARTHGLSRPLESCLADLSIFIERRIQILPLRALLSTIDVFALVNFQTNELFAFSFSEGFGHRDYFNFLIGYMNQKARALSATGPLPALPSASQ